MMNTMCQHGEKVEHMEDEIGKMKHGFNEVISGVLETTNVIMDTLTNDVQDRLKAAEDALPQSHRS
jgi:hypothetical protein